MEAKEMRFELIVDSLTEKKTTEAKEHLNHLRKIEDNKGFIRACEGMISAIEEQNEDSLLYQIFNDEVGDGKIGKLKERFEKWESEPFRDQYEDGYHSAWLLFLNNLELD